MWRRTPCAVGRTRRTTGRGRRRGHAGPRARGAGAAASRRADVKRTGADAGTSASDEPGRPPGWRGGRSGAVTRRVRHGWRGRGTFATGRPGVARDFAVAPLAGGAGSRRAAIRARRGSTLGARPARRPRDPRRVGRALVGGGDGGRSPSVASPAPELGARWAPAFGATDPRPVLAEAAFGPGPLKRRSSDRRAGRCAASRSAGARRLPARAGPTGNLNVGSRMAAASTRTTRVRGVSGWQATCNRAGRAGCRRARASGGRGAQVPLGQRRSPLSASRIAL